MEPRNWEGYLIFDGSTATSTNFSELAIQTRFANGFVTFEGTERNQGSVKKTFFRLEAEYFSDNNTAFPALPRTRK